MKKYTRSLRKLPKFHPIVQLCIALSLFIISVIASRDTEIANWEIVVFNFMYTLPTYLYLPFFLITQTGSIFMLGFLSVMYVLKQRYHVVIRLLMSGTLAYTLSGVAKDLWGRVRPTEYLVDIVNLDYVVRGMGFPSGHVALATALALTVGHYLPRKYHWVIAAWIIGVGLSRMYLGIHFPMDIVGGFAIGWFSYALFRNVRLYDVRFSKRINKQLKNKPSSQRSVR